MVPRDDAGPAGADAPSDTGVNDGVVRDVAFSNEDTDGDTIVDGHEGTGDSDNDGTPDFQDLDSDNDGFADAEEAGDADPATEPIDTDDGGIYDFRDLDSDGDGVADSLERTDGTNPRLTDTDADGVSDLAERIAGTDPLNPDSNPSALGDFFFLVPYNEAPQPARRR